MSGNVEMPKRQVRLKICCRSSFGRHSARFMSAPSTKLNSTQRTPHRLHVHRILALDVEHGGTRALVSTDGDPPNSAARTPPQRTGFCLPPTLTLEHSGAGPMRNRKRRLHRRLGFHLRQFLNQRDALDRFAVRLHRRAPSSQFCRLNSTTSTLAPIRP